MAGPLEYVGDFRRGSRSEPTYPPAQDTWADEVCGYALAGLGLYTQWTYGFALLFPYNLIMAPFTAVEWYIRWSVTYV